MSPMYRIVCDSLTPMGNLKIVTQDGSEMPLHGVRHIQINVPVSGPIIAKVEMMTEVDMLVKGEFVRRRLNTQTGKYEAISPYEITINVDDLANVIDGYGHEITGEDEDRAHERLKALMTEHYDRYFPEPEG